MTSATAIPNLLLRFHGICLLLRYFPRKNLPSSGLSMKSATHVPYSGCWMILSALLFFKQHQSIYTRFFEILIVFARVFLKKFQQAWVIIHLKSSPLHADFFPSSRRQLAVFLHFVLRHPPSNCLPRAVVPCCFAIFIAHFPPTSARFFPCEARLLVLLHHSFGTNSSHIALSARMSASSFAGSPQYAFTLTRKVAVPASILARNNWIATRKISASGAPANVAFPPSPTHLIRRVCLIACM